MGVDLKIDVYHHLDSASASGGSAILDTINGKLDQILVLLTQQGAFMSALSDAVDALVARVNTDVQHLQDLVTAANQSAADAAANDAADAATIADLQAQLDASNADAAATVARIQAIDPVSDFPGVPPDPGADPNPPVDTTVPPDPGTGDVPPPDGGGDVPPPDPNVLDPSQDAPPSDGPVVNPTLGPDGNPVA